MMVEAEKLYAYMMRTARHRGGYIFEGARPAFESGEYQDSGIAALLRLGWIVPHPDPAKGWVPVPKTPPTPTPE
jgi:hypothetical protein